MLLNRTLVLSLATLSLTACASGDESQVRATVQGYQGQLTYCYEQQLKVVPTLQGRVEIGWSVRNGIVSSGPYIVANTTGDADLADCVIKKIRRWEFPPDFSGEMSFPFVFSRKDSDPGR